MHKIQKKILKLAKNHDISDLTLREIGAKIGEPDSPQKIKHHLHQLAKKGFIFIDEKSGKIEKLGRASRKDSNIINLPIMGDANCGKATSLANDDVEGYLHLTKGILGNLSEKTKDLFVLRGIGTSMNKARIKGQSIEDGDYVLVDRSKNNPNNGDYIVSIIDDVANIKRYYKQENRIVLLSESTKNIPPIYIHKEDLDEYMVVGTIVDVFKKPKQLEELEQINDIDS